MMVILLDVIKLINNWDQTANKYYVPVSYWIQEVEGSKCNKIVDIDDKREIIATLAATAGGKFLPAQPIYGGKTSTCIPKLDFPSKWSTV